MNNLSFLEDVRSDYMSTLRKQKGSYYFHHLPYELIGTIFYYLDVNSFENIYKLGDESVRYVLFEKFNWKQFFQELFGHLLDYIPPLRDSFKTSNEVKFYYRLTYYRKCINAYIESYKVFLDLKRHYYLFRN